MIAPSTQNATATKPTKIMPVTEAVMSLLLVFWVVPMIASEVNTSIASD